MTDSPRPLIGIITVSDRASRGQYEDRSGPAVEEALRSCLATECDYSRRVIADDQEAVVAAIRDLAGRRATLICTTGGTGPAPRDVTPEATAEACDKLLPGFGELMRRVSLEAGVPTAILSRQTAGVVEHSLVINLPGKPTAIKTCLQAVVPAVPDCVDLIGGPCLQTHAEVIRAHRPGKE